MTTKFDDFVSFLDDVRAQSGTFRRSGQFTIYMKAPGFQAGTKCGAFNQGFIENTENGRRTSLMDIKDIPVAKRKIRGMARAMGIKIPITTPTPIDVVAEADKIVGSNLAHPYVPVSDRVTRRDLVSTNSIR